MSLDNTDLLTLPPAPNTPDETAAAVRMTARLARDMDDLRLLLDVLGIDVTTMKETT